MNVEISRIIDTQCEDLKGLLDELDVVRAVIVACSSGAMIARKFAYLYPERVINMVFVDSYFHGGDAALAGRAMGIFEICALAAHYLPAEMFMRSLRITYNKWLSAYHILRRELLQERTTELIKQRLALRQADSFGFAAGLQIPVLCVTGNQNERVLELAKKTVAQYPLARLAILDDAMYPSHLCQPQHFNRLVLDYLQDQQCFRQAASGK